MINKITHLNKLVLLLSILVVLLTPSTSDAFIFSSKKSRLLDKANEAFANAEKISNEGRALPAITAWIDARNLYNELIKNYPEYETEYVQSQYGKCITRQAILQQKISSGEIAIPSPDQVVAGHSDMRTTAPITFDNPSPEPIKTPTPSPMVQEFVEDPEIIETVSSDNELVNASDNQRIHIVNSLIDTKRATDAVFKLEEIVESEKEETSLITRMLFVRALMETGNYTRAKDHLTIAKKINENDPSVRSVSAALFVAEGNLHSALNELDLLVSSHPEYADLYINMAYIIYMMQPSENRELAASYYRHGLAHGAKRDPNFESSLNIEIK